MTLRIEPVTPERWDDLETLFGPNGAYSNCWCTWWTWRASEWDSVRSGDRRKELRAQVRRGDEPGLLAYDGEDPVGWCAVAPRERYARLSSPRARTYRSPDGAPSWVVTCFFVRPDRRGAGVASALLSAVAAFVTEHGGMLVEGYPVEDTDRGTAALYTGTIDMFREEGFVEAARFGDRPLVRLQLPSTVGAAPAHPIAARRAGARSTGAAASPRRTTSPGP